MSKYNISNVDIQAFSVVQKRLHPYQRGRNRGRTLFSRPDSATYGRRVQGREYTVVIPARPFLMVQDEDWENINGKVKEYLVRSE
ncbi:MAG: hypothetical protein GY749_14540 [Desulfobacteraceae bacterium]|nr:hypothetical protein [Desulfobacteraceae bacterium]